MLTESMRGNYSLGPVEMTAGLHRHDVFRGVCDPSAARIANTNYGRDLFMLGDLPALCRQLNQRMPSDVVDMSDGRELKTGEWSNVRQVGSVKIDVMESGCNQNNREDCCASCKLKDDSPPPQSD